MSILFLGAAPEFHCTDNLGHDDRCSDSFGKTCYNFTYETDEIQSSLVTKWNLVCSRVFLIPIMQVSQKPLSSESIIFSAELDFYRVPILVELFSVI